jgi:hypothetical protein
MTSKNKKSSNSKERGTWLSIWLILIILHSILSVILIIDLTKQPDATTLPWYLSLLFIAAVAKIVAAVAIWLWERWGLYLYAGAILVSTIIGILMTGTLLIVFNDVLPLAILGYLLRNKWDYFNKE